MGWLIALAVISLLAVLPLGISAKYDELGPQLWVIAGPVRLKLLPEKRKTQDKEKKPKAEKKSSVKYSRHKNLKKSNTSSKRRHAIFTGNFRMQGRAF